MGYSHVQRSPLTWFIAAAAAGVGIGAYALKGHMPEALFAWLGAVVGVLLTGSFARLKTEDAGDSLVVRYGPLPVFTKRIPYATIKEARAGRTSLIDGWGIHWLPWRGWTYNLWGRQCVAIRTEHGTVRVGTDDAPGLERFLRGKLAPPDASLPSTPQNGAVDVRGGYGLSNLRAAAGFVRRSVEALRQRARSTGSQASDRG